jgi:hypothetical protein
MALSTIRYGCSFSSSHPKHGELLPPDGTAEKREALDDEGVTEKVIKIGAKVVRDAQ